MSTTSVTNALKRTLMEQAGYCTFGTCWFLVKLRGNATVAELRVDEVLRLLLGIIRMRPPYRPFSRKFRTSTSLSTQNVKAP
eukprot:2877115-Amphidinium_carterae.1